MDTLSAWLARKGIHIYKVRRYDCYNVFKCEINP